MLIYYTDVVCLSISRISSFVLTFIITHVQKDETQGGGGGGLKREISGSFIDKKITSIIRKFTKTSYIYKTCKRSR